MRNEHFEEERAPGLNPDYLQTFFLSLTESRQLLNWLEQHLSLSVLTGTAEPLHRPVYPLDVNPLPHDIIQVIGIFV